MVYQFQLSFLLIPCRLFNFSQVSWTRKQFLRHWAFELPRVMWSAEKSLGSAAAYAKSGITFQLDFSLSRSALVLTFYACKLQTTKLSHFNNSGKIQITSLDTTRFPYPKNPILQADTVFENDIKSRIFQKGNQRFRNTILFHYFSDLNFLSQRIISTVFKHCEAEDFRSRVSSTFLRLCQL